MCALAGECSFALWTLSIYQSSTSTFISSPRFARRQASGSSCIWTTANIINLSQVQPGVPGGQESSKVTPLRNQQDSLSPQRTEQRGSTTSKLLLTAALQGPSVREWGEGLAGPPLGPQTHSPSCGFHAQLVPSGTWKPPPTSKPSVPARRRWPLPSLPAWCRALRAALSCLGGVLESPGEAPRPATCHLALVPARWHQHPRGSSRLSHLRSQALTTPALAHRGRQVRDRSRTAVSESNSVETPSSASSFLCSWLGI